MNITDFEEYFSPRILERGKEYYRNHHVITLDRIEEGYYEAEVEPNLYRVCRTGRKR